MTLQNINSIGSFRKSEQLYLETIIREEDIFAKVVSLISLSKFYQYNPQQEFTLLI